MVRTFTISVLHPSHAHLTSPPLTTGPRYPGSRTGYQPQRAPSLPPSANGPSSFCDERAGHPFLRADKQLGVASGPSQVMSGSSEPRTGPRSASHQRRELPRPAGPTSCEPRIPGTPPAASRRFEFGLKLNSGSII